MMKILQGEMKLSAKEITSIRQMNDLIEVSVLLTKKFLCVQRALFSVMAWNHLYTEKVVIIKED